MTRRDWLWAAAFSALTGGTTPLPGKDFVIESIALWTCRVVPRSWFLFEVRTSAGLTGLGDATAGGQVPARGAVVARRLLEVMKGRSPFEIERLRNASLSMVSEAGRSDKRSTAATCSGMEQALWDLQGKALGVPCHKLFGGKLRDRIRNYANINRATRGDDRSPAGFAANARRATQAGFDAIKLAPFDHIDRDERDRSAIEDGISRGVAFLQAVREAIGPDCDLLIDGHGRFDAPQAIRLAERLAPFGLYWMEEMCRETRDLALFSEAVNVQTAGGESLWSVHEFYPYIQANAVNTVMPDVKYCGGMLELKKIAAMAEGAGLLVSPHGPASPVGNMAAAHVCATLPNFDILEFAFGEVPWRAETVEPAEDVSGGYLQVPNRPGIGYEMNPKHWQQFPA